MKRLLSFVVAFFVLVLVPAAPLLAAGGSSKPTPATAPAGKTVEEEATDLYNRGLSQRDRAWRFEDELAAASDAKKRGKLQKKLDRAWKAALGDFEAAVRRVPRMHEAHSSMGYVLRRTGDYAAAMEAYDRALELDPDYVEAIEYRAEAFLALHRIDAAKQAYDVLMRKDKARAGELLAAMHSWVAHQREAGDADADDVRSLARWIDERTEIGGHGTLGDPGRKARSW